MLKVEPTYGAASEAFASWLHYRYTTPKLAPYGEKLVKISPVDPDIVLLK